MACSKSEQATTLHRQAAPKQKAMLPECGFWQERAALGFQVPPHDDYADVDSQASTEELGGILRVADEGLGGLRSWADAERRAFLKAFEADDQERRRDEALESALRAYEPTSPTSASVSVHDIQWGIECRIWCGVRLPISLHPKMELRVCVFAGDLDTLTSQVPHLQLSLIHI